MRSVGPALAVVVAVGTAGTTWAAPPSSAKSAISIAPAAGTAPAVFALIVGVNASDAPDVAPLQYADDDAARYLDLFRALGANAVILSRLDDNTRRLHPQAAAEASAPSRAELTRAVDRLALDIARARARGVRTTLYFVYAGHGDGENGTWSLTLEGGRLTGTQLLSELLDRAGADESHLIIDACQAYLLAMPRGPGGTRRPAAGFVELEAASHAGRVGYLLSSSVSGETHEWSGFEAGVFSHEVRSGLYGAADADGDGRVTYAEIGAFVARANDAIQNQRFRPQVIARAPRGDDVLLDLRGRRDQGLRFQGADVGAHYLLENELGVRLLDFHGSPSTPLQLVRPPGEGRLYLRRLSDGAERTVPREDGVVELAELAVAPARVRERGAASHAFATLFAHAFDGAAVSRWNADQTRVEASLDAARSRDEADARARRTERIAGWTAVGVAAGAAVGAVAAAVSAHRLYDDAPVGESQLDTVARNDRIELRNRFTIGLAAGALVAGAVGTWLLVRPHRSTATPALDLALSPEAGVARARWSF